MARAPDSDAPKISYTLATVAQVGIDHIEAMMDVISVPKSFRGAVWQSVIKIAMAKVIECEGKTE